MAAELLQKQGKAERKKRQRAAREAGEEEGEEGDEDGPGGAKRMAAAAFDVYEGDVKMQKEEEVDEDDEEEDKLVRTKAFMFDVVGAD